ncbi:hypothetical protein V8E52_006861 [Russula decolorans]
MVWLGLSLWWGYIPSVLFPRSTSIDGKSVYARRCTHAFLHLQIWKRAVRPWKEWHETEEKVLSPFSLIGDHPGLPQNISFQRKARDLCRPELVTPRFIL